MKAANGCGIKLRNVWEGPLVIFWHRKTCSAQNFSDSGRSGPKIWISIG